jgi:hypothetical protein
MKITSVTATWLHVPIPEDRQHTSDFGRTTSFDSTLVRIETDAGIVGWGEGKAAVGQALRQAGGRIHHEFDELSAFAVTVPVRALSGLSRNPNVTMIEEDPKRYPMAQRVPYGIPMVQADQVSDANAGNRMVCVIDSGYDLGHEDLQSGVSSALQCQECRAAGQRDLLRDLQGGRTYGSGRVATEPVATVARVVHLQCLTKPSRGACADSRITPAKSFVRDSTSSGKLHCAAPLTRPLTDVVGY